MKLWSGRFTAHANELLDQYNASLPFDYQLADFDVQGSVAHVKMLAKCDIIDADSAEKIIQGLHVVLHKLKQSDHVFPVQDEDIHMHIEKQLFAEIGPVAGKLHTGRSRNDQVALDMHLYVRHHSSVLVEQLNALNKVLIGLAEQHIDVLMPGYTHLQRAEPVRLSHHLLAYVSMFKRDIQKMQACFANANISPLGAGALAGSGFAVDREYVAELLGMESVYSNSLDAVSNRDYIAEFLFAASLIMMHISKFSEELILWCSQEFSFIELGDSFCTGSSMMPQKKNPDIPELARGKTGRVYGALMGLLTVLKGLPLAYNKDFQEDKEGLFDTVQTVEQTLVIFTAMLESMTVKQDKMQQAVTQDYSNATQLANYLVAKGIAFREAHRITGELVLHAIGQGVYLLDLDLALYQQACELIAADIYEHLNPLQVVEAHLAKGGTAKVSVEWQLENMSKLTDTSTGDGGL